MVKVIWLRCLATNKLKCFEFNGYNDTLKIGDYISQIQVGIKTDKNDFGRETWSTNDISYNNYRVEMIKGFEDFDSFSYYCDIHKQWSYIKGYEWVRQDAPRDVIYKYLHETDISDDGKSIIYYYKENFYNNYEVFISAIRDELDNVTITQGEERMDIDNYVIVRFPDRWGNFNKDSKTYLFTATETVFKNLEIGSIIGITQTYDTNNGLLTDCYKDKKIRVEAKFCCSKKNIARLPQFSNFEEIYIKQITLHTVFSETFTSEELTRISCEFDYMNASHSYSYKIYEAKNTLYLKTFSEVVEYITKQRAANLRTPIIFSEEDSNIVSTTSSPMSISVDNSNNLPIDERFKALNEKIDNALKMSLEKKEQKNEDYICRIERIIAESDFVVPFGNERGTLKGSTEEKTIVDAETFKPYDDNTLIKAGTAYYRYTCSKHPIKIWNNNNNKERKFMNIFKNFNFGELKTPSIACSFKGIAFKGTDGSYCVYDIDANEAINVSDFIVDIPLYTIPVSKDSLKKGDIILHKNCFYIVKVNGASTFEAIDPIGGTIQFLVPEKSIFGFNYYTKVVSPFSMMNSTASEDNPFGNMLPFLFMNNKEDNEDFKYLMMFSLMGNKDTNMNQMLPFLFMNNDKEMNPMAIMMLMQNFNSDVTPVPKESNNEDMNGIKQELAEIKATLTQFNDIINEA